MTIFDVTLERTQRLTMTVGIDAENAKDAEHQVMQKEKVNRDAGWTAHKASPPKVAEVKKRPGKELLGRKNRPCGRWDYDAA